MVDALPEKTTPFSKEQRQAGSLSAAPLDPHPHRWSSRHNNFFDGGETTSLHGSAGMASSPLLIKLPYELHSLIVQHLDLADIRALSLTCRRLQFLVDEQSIAKTILEVRRCCPSFQDFPLFCGDEATQTKLVREQGADCCG